VPLPGPLDQSPLGVTSMAEARAMLDDALAGLVLGGYDRRIVAWLAGWDQPTIAAVASLLHRARTTNAPAHASRRRSR
jgi:hypothetical protein